MRHPKDNFFAKCGIPVMVIVLCIFMLQGPVHAADSRWEILTFLNKNKIYTVEDYAVWLKENIQYQPDKGKDIWSQPLETLKKRGGDCEDLAFLSAEVLKIFGYQPRIIAVGKGRLAHAICVFKNKDIYFAFDNIDLNETFQTSFDNMMKFLVKSKQAEFILEFSNKPKHIYPLYVVKKPGGPVTFGRMEKSSGE